MNKYRRDMICIIALVAAMALACLFIDLIHPGWAYNEPADYIYFECYKHNFTQFEMEPMVRYICFENQSCYAWNDGYGGGLFVVLTECMVSQAVVGNKTIVCNGTVEDCEYFYNKEGI